MTKDDARFAARKWSFDQNFFEKIDNSKKAYFLGWLMADGCNFKEKYSYCVSINLKSSDEDILHVLNSFIGSSRPILRYTTNGKSVSRLHFSSKKLGEDLIKLGCTPKKSTTLLFPEVKEEFIFDFLRGYFDGDGSIFNRKKRPNEYVISMISSDLFSARLKEYIFLKLGVNFHIKKQGKVSVLELYQRNSIKAFMDKIYENSSGMRLSRKYKKYLEFLAFCKSRENVRLGGFKVIETPVSNV